MRIFVSYFLIFTSLLFAEVPKLSSSPSLTEFTKLTASNGEPVNNFGDAIAMYGNTLVVGASGYDLETGIVYVYEYNESNSQYDEVAQLKQSYPDRYDRFGISVAMLSDTIVVGATGDDLELLDGTTINAGAAYVFKKPSSGWSDASEDLKLTALDASHYDDFGYSVAISDDAIVVGAYHHSTYRGSGSVYVFKKTADGWGNVEESINLTDINTIVVDDGYNTDGHVTDLGIHETAKLTASNAEINVTDYFAYSVSISGTTIVAGAYLKTVEGVFGQGAVYVFEKPISGWHNANEDAILTATDGVQSDYFGYSVAINTKTIVIGATGNTGYNDEDSYGDGAVYIFEKPLNGWSNATVNAKLTVLDANAYSELGRHVSISGDTVVGGAINTYHVGSAYIFDKPLNGWSNATESAKLVSSDATDNLNDCVAISGKTIVVGADSLNDNEGSAYVFKRKEVSINPSIIIYLLN